MHLPEYQVSKRNCADIRKCFGIPQTTPCSKLYLQSMSYTKKIYINAQLCTVKQRHKYAIIWISM